MKLGEWYNVDHTIEDGLLEVYDKNGNRLNQLGVDGFHTWTVNNGYSYEMTIKENAYWGYVNGNEGSFFMPATVTTYTDIGRTVYGCFLRTDRFSFEIGEVTCEKGTMYDAPIRLMGADGTTHYTLAFHKGWLLSVTED